MKSSTALPFITYLTLTSAAATSSPDSTAKRAQPTTLSPEQYAALSRYTEPQATKPAFSSVNAVLSSASIGPKDFSSQEASFRIAALATPKPTLPPYLSIMPKKEKSYLSSYYAAQASIIQKAVEPSSTTTTITAKVKTITKATTKLLSTSIPHASLLPVTGPPLRHHSATPTKHMPRPGPLSSGNSSSSRQSNTSTSTTAEVGPSALDAAGSPSPSPSDATAASQTGRAAAQQTGMAQVAGLGLLGVVGLVALM